MLFIAVETHTERRAERNILLLGYFITAITSKVGGKEREV